MTWSIRVRGFYCFLFHLCLFPHVNVSCPCLMLSVEALHMMKGGQLLAPTSDAFCGKLQDVWKILPALPRDCGWCFPSKKHKIEMFALDCFPTGWDLNEKCYRNINFWGAAQGIFIGCMGFAWGHPAWSFQRVAASKEPSNNSVPDPTVRTLLTKGSYLHDSLVWPIVHHTQEHIHKTTEILHKTKFAENT